MQKRPRAKYTLEYKLEALRLIGAGQSVAVVAATLGVADQTLHNWLKAQREGRLGGPGSKPVSPEQMELARLRAELARTKMELDIVKKAALDSTRRCNSFLVQECSEVRIYGEIGTAWAFGCATSRFVGEMEGR